MFTWFDYITVDAARAQAFYGALFGWTTQTIQVTGMGAYTMIVVDDRPIGGYLGPIAGTPPSSPRDTRPGSYWLSHLVVASAHDAAAKTKTLGGKMLREPFNVGEHGKLAIALDPANAVVALSQPNTITEWNHAPNTFVWNELYTTSTTTAVTFYKQLAGFTESKMAMPDGNTYHLMQRDGVARCGIRKPHPGMPAGWFAWVRVANVDDTAAKARALGATIHTQPADVGTSRMSLLTDPQGAALGIITPH
jgi:hypothetical protein